MCIRDRPRPAPLASVRLCISGAAPLSEQTAVRFERLGGTRVIEGYGLSETAPVTHVNLPGKSRYGSIGLPMPDTMCRIVEVEAVSYTHLDVYKRQVPGRALP